MRLLVRDPKPAETKLGPRFEYLPGSVTDSAAVDRAVRGVDGVHISLGVEDPRPAQAGRAPGDRGGRSSSRLQRISYLTGSPVRVDYGPKILEHRAKLAAEEAIQDSGVPYTFFRPTYFTKASFAIPAHRQHPRNRRRRIRGHRLQRQGRLCHHVLVHAG